MRNWNAAAKILGPIREARLRVQRHQLRFALPDSIEPLLDVISQDSDVCCDQPKMLSRDSDLFEIRRGTFPAPSQEGSQIALFISDEYGTRPFISWRNVSG